MRVRKVDIAGFDQGTDGLCPRYLPAARVHREYAGNLVSEHLNYGRAVRFVLNQDHFM